MPANAADADAVEDGAVEDGADEGGAAKDGAAEDGTAEDGADGDGADTKMPYAPWSCGGILRSQAACFASMSYLWLVCCVSSSGAWFQGGLMPVFSANQVSSRVYICTKRTPLGVPGPENRTTIHLFWPIKSELMR